MNASIPSELVIAYSETTISIQLDNFQSVVIKGTIAETDSANFLDFFGAHIQELWVITADNPFSKLLSPEDNLQRQQSLHAALANKGIDFLEAFCSSPDRSWSEHSFAVLATNLSAHKIQIEIHKLARCFGQNAVFKVTPSILSMISTLGDSRNEKSEVLFTSNYSCILD
ncbi:hypothetical protein AINA4_02380 [Aurantimicrobium sp. INA4]|uniref:DUF3293 domain-containing protein n=1 Tax=Aurantimicrobium sp. INA4 TaxID=2986279 RepID=UPI002492C1D5|nr:DUF3293 domain-containing protein [Aurantimicrobium sp. INA4]BDU10317.1 hypothetical protein AINA4_02380 [Aurantimicrobium sp. INA4]